MGLSFVQGQQEDVKQVREKVSEEEAIVASNARETGKIRDSARAELDKAMPIYYAAVGALRALDKNDLIEVKSFTKQPHLVTIVMNAVW